MLRKDIVKQLDAVADKARKIGAIRIECTGTGSAVEVESSLAKHLITASLAYASLLVDGKAKKQDPERVVAAIVGTAVVRNEADK